MKRLLLLAAFCAFAAAMVPRERRALNTEEDPQPSTAPATPICATSTPCGWAFYKPNGKIEDMHVDNSYCQCDAGATCLIDENDKTSNTYIKRCKSSSLGSTTQPFEVENLES